jgi:Kef-type K+ transport system membrane component KefB
MVGPPAARWWSDPLADSLPNVALALSLMLVAGRLGASAARRLGQPSVLGELLVGVILGNLPALGVTRLAPLVGSSGVALLAQLGAVLLLFEVGVEQRLKDMRRLGPRSAAVAACGVTASFALGWLVARALLPQAPPLARIFLAASLTATSVGIGAAVLRDLVRVDTDEGRLMIGAAVVDDVLALAVLSAVTAVMSAEASPARVVASLGGALLFLIGAVAIGSWLGPRIVRAAARLHAPGAQLGVALGICFALSWAANAVGLAAIVGAFAAGLVLEPDKSLLDELRPTTSLLAPLFFISTGLHTDLKTLLRPDALLLAGGLTVAAIAGKIACAAAAGRGVDRWAVALGMIPRGEVQLVYATLGTGLLVDGAPVLGAERYAAIVAVVFVTTLLAPPLLRMRLLRA